MNLCSLSIRHAPSQSYSNLVAARKVRVFHMISLKLSSNRLIYDGYDVINVMIYIEMKEIATVRLLLVVARLILFYNVFIMIQVFV